MKAESLTSNQILLDLKSTLMVYEEKNFKSYLTD